MPTYRIKFLLSRLAVAAAMVAVLAGIVLLGFSRPSDSSIPLEPRHVAWACAKDSGRITNIRWDGPPRRCDNGDSIWWYVETDGLPDLVRPPLAD